MSDIKLFRYNEKDAQELSGKEALVEKQLQALIERQMETFLGVRFLATEYSTGKTHKGRIDSLGLDENGCPVIMEYKRHTNENVINQGLFYLDWLMDHQAEYRELVAKKLGKEHVEEIEWGSTRLVCIASDFTKYDEYAVMQIQRNIELIRYKLFDPDLLLLELVNAVSVENTSVSSRNTKNQVRGDSKAQAVLVEASSAELLALLGKVSDFINAQGDDVQEKPLKLYTAFKRLRNFACVAVTAVKNDPHVRLWLKIDPSTVRLEDGFTRDVSAIGHWGTGDLEVQVRSSEDFEKLRPLIERSYREN